MDITGAPLAPVRVLAELARLLAHASTRTRAAELFAAHLARTLADGCLVEVGRASAVDHRRDDAAASLRGLGLVSLHAHASAHPAYAQVLLDGALGRVTVWREHGGAFADAEVELASACVDAFGLALAHLPARDVDDLQRAVAIRDELLSVASHDLRTPLTALGLQLEMIERLLARHASADELHVRADGARRALAELTEILDRVLDVARISAGKLSLQLGEVDLRDVIQDVCDRLAPDAQRAGCPLAIELDSVTGRWDRVRVDQIATHLVSNAIKHAPGAVVRVHLATDGARACLEVADGGAGASRDRGLGHYLSRELARAHGGDLELDSEPGRGARFKVTLPR